MSIWVRDFSNKEGVRLGDCLTQFQKNLPEWGAWGFKPAPVSGLIQLFFPGGVTLERWLSPMVLGPDPWSLTLGPTPNTAVPTRRVGYKLRAVPGGSSSSESGAARSLARNGLVLGAKKSQQFAPFQFLLVDFCWWLTFELFPVYIYTCFSKYWISSAILVEHFPKVWQGTNLRPWTTTLPITRAGPRVPKFGTAMHGMMAENTLISSSYFGYSLLSEVCRNWWGFF